jgi:U-box domain
MNIPHLFRCPISLDLFTDPVTLCTGQTYERRSIEKWLQAGNRTCPVTMQLLYDTTLVPNHNLRHLIEQWLLTNPDMNHRIRPSGVGPNPSPNTDMEMSLATIRSVLELECAAEDSKIEMLKKVQNLSIESDVNQAFFIQLGFFPLLLDLIFQSPTDLAHSSSELLELSLGCVLMLSPSSNLNSLNKILTNDLKLSSMVILLSQGSKKIKTSLCCLIENIALSEQTKELAIILGQSPHVMRSLAVMLDNNADAPASDACVRALNSLCSLEANRQNALGEGVVHGLINYLSKNSTKKSDSAKALAALQFLLASEIENNNLPDINNLIRVLVKHIFEVSSENEGSEYAVSILLTMCCNSEWAREESIGAGVVTQLLLLIQSQCSESAKTKARNLLKLLRIKCRDNFFGGPCI